MLTNLPDHIVYTFVIICAVTLFFFVKMLVEPLKQMGKKKTAWVLCGVILIWLIIHSILASQSFYTSSYELPPRGLLMVAPPMIAIFISLIFLWKSNYFKMLSLSTMTYIHTFRLPLELIVFSALFSSGYIPKIMTYYGSNFDILVGLTAPIVAYLYFSKNKISNRVLLAWNIISLMLLITISTLAILSIPYPFQQFGINQPNVAVVNFPFIFIPSLLVAIAYFCHIISIHKLLVFKHTNGKSE